MSAPYLQIDDEQGRRKVVLDQPVFRIGRRETADLQIANGGVSREHAEIRTDGEEYVLIDCKSRHGTFVNGAAVAQHTLKHGDRIRLGVAGSIEVEFRTLAEDTSGWSSSGHVDLRQMAGLLNGLRALGSGRVLDEVLTLVVDSALDVTGADRGFVMLAGPAGTLEFRVARAVGRISLPGTTFDTSRITEQVFRTGESAIIPDLLLADVVEQHPNTVQMGIRSVLCVPLRVVQQAAGRSGGAGDIIGVLYLDGRRKASLLARSTPATLETFATEAALAIESARLYAQAADKARLDRELLMAAEMQHALLPQPRYTGPGIDLAAVSLACRTVGGDFYDYLELPDGAFAFALGDVAGKGPPAALLAVAAQSLFSANASLCLAPDATMDRINTALRRRSIEARFATMFHAVLHPDGRLVYSNAGHEAPVLLGSARSLVLDRGGLVLGLFDDATYESGIVQLAPGDSIVVSSDGVAEARNLQDEEFGRHRIAESVAGVEGGSAAAVLDALLSALEAFTRGTPQADDITALVVTFARLRR